MMQRFKPRHRIICEYIRVCDKSGDDLNLVVQQKVRLFPINGFNAIESIYYLASSRPMALNGDDSFCGSK